jgi:putative SOS response-associated peptidase YedK
MCGRYSLFTPPSELAERFGVETSRGPRYNCTPGQRLPVITNESPDRFTRQEWGFVPEWADDDASPPINARAETIGEKPTFADAFESRRCLVPADGFYEWVDDGDETRPYRVAFEDDRPFAMAGVWARWTPPTEQAGLGEFGGDGPSGPETRETFAVVTTEPNELVADLHHRMAVILPPEAESDWLSGDSESVRSLLDTHPGDDMRAYEVSRRVNDPGNDAPDLIEPAGS